MEMEDEADGLVDQTMPSRQPLLPGLPGLTMPNTNNDGSSVGGAQKFPPGIGNLPPPPPIPPPGGFPGMDPAKFRELLASGQLPPPPLPGQALPPPPVLPPNFDFSKLPAGMLPPGFPPPPPPPFGAGTGGLPGIGSNDSMGSGGGGGIRRRGPLPSQQESLKEEQRKGKFRPVR